MGSRIRTLRTLAVAAFLFGSFGAALADYTVVLDPGHGGRDGGASGRAGTAEKVVTLEFANYLADELRENAGLAVVLTRDSDVAVPLRRRVAIARENEANLFISIHADSIDHPTLRGASIYTLSDRASDRIARSLADSEARSDVLAGFGAAPAEDEVEGILLDLMRQETEVFSRGFAERVVVSLAGHMRVIGNPHRSANFQVLRAPDVPSVLVELGYLSNRDDEKLLRDPKWLEKMATVLAEAIVEHARDTGALREAAAQ